MITRDDVDQAAARIKGLTRLTPVLEADRGTFAGPVWFKCEFMQHTGTFKARGALNRILASRERGELRPEVGVVVASGGNAGLANAYAAAQLGVPATVFVPDSAPAFKVRKLEAIGATVIQGGAEYAVAYEAAIAHDVLTTGDGSILHDPLAARLVAAGAAMARLGANVPTLERLAVEKGSEALVARLVLRVPRRIREGPSPGSCILLRSLGQGRSRDRGNDAGKKQEESFVRHGWLLNGTVGVRN